MSYIWTDADLTNVAVRKIHIDELVTNLNTERTRRNLSTITITTVALQTRILTTHITTLRDTIAATPLSVGCTARHATVYSARNTTYDSYDSYASTRNSPIHSYDSWYFGGHNGTAYVNWALGSGNCGSNQCSSR